MATTKGPVPIYNPDEQDMRQIVVDLSDAHDANLDGFYLRLALPIQRVPTDILVDLARDLDPDSPDALIEALIRTVDRHLLSAWFRRRIENVRYTGHR